MMWDVHASKRTSTGMTTDVVAVHNMTVGEDVGEHALGTKLAVSLCMSVGALSHLP